MEKRVAWGLTILAWILLLVIFLPLSVFATRALAGGDGPCGAIEDDRTGEVASRSWVPPSLTCEYTYPDGTITRSEHNYWAVFLPTLVLAVFAGFQTQRRFRDRARDRDRSRGERRP